MLFVLLFGSYTKLSDRERMISELKKKTKFDVTAVSMYQRRSADSTSRRC